MMNAVMIDHQHHSTLSPSRSANCTWAFGLYMISVAATTATRTDPIATGTCVQAVLTGGGWGPARESSSSSVSSPVSPPPVVEPSASIAALSLLHVVSAQPTLYGLYPPVVEYFTCDEDSSLSDRCWTWQAQESKSTGRTTVRISRETSTGLAALWTAALGNVPPRSCAQHGPRRQRGLWQVLEVDDGRHCWRAEKMRRAAASTRAWTKPPQALQSLRPEWIARRRRRPGETRWIAGRLGARAARPYHFTAKLGTTVPRREVVATTDVTQCGERACVCRQTALK